MAPAWAADCDEAMDEAGYDGITVDLGSAYRAYAHVMNIGFASLPDEAVRSQISRRDLTASAGGKSDPTWR
ncbi:hypothetical protein ACFVZD_32535 [Streptomyces sp. NPDC058287]|uniref:hypothetical protein n=1 Tax=Streptomyces sp. NPDC058287 TaxID=3346423 RepID=UPI0036E8129A